jgi:hypothetical protein
MSDTVRIIRLVLFFAFLCLVVSRAHSSDLPAIVSSVSKVF